MVQAALLCGAGYIETRGEASLYHGDLGLHNVMVDRSSGIARLGIVIDFGNSLFLPHYKNEEDIRKYGGFGVDVLDVTERFGIPQTEQEVTNRLLWFGQVIFLERSISIRTGSGLFVSSSWTIAEKSQVICSRNTSVRYFYE